MRFKPTEDFENLFDLSDSTFNEDQKDDLLNLLWDFEDIFHRPGPSLGCTDILEFAIKLKPDSRPFKASPYRSNPRVRQEIERQVKDMLKEDIIEPSVSPYASPVVLVNKPDGSYRFCVDFRKLNSMTEIDSHIKW